MKLKICDGCQCERVIWKNHLGMQFCKSCWQRQAVTDRKYKPTKIAPRSLKRTKQERDYYKLRDEFLKANPVCKANIPGKCTHTATDVHHKCGRVGSLLTDVRFFLPVCRECHEYIENNPEIAKSLKLSFNRLTK